MKTSTVIASPPVIASEAKQSLVIARGEAPKQSCGRSPRRCAPRDDACMKVIAKPAGLKQSPRRYAPRDDDGFGLLELMLAAMIAAGITLGYLYNQSRQSAISQAQSQAGYYQMVSDAVANYMAINYDQLKAITQPKTCSEPRLFTDATAAPAPTGCGIQAFFLSGSDSSPIANGLQPTLTELKTTGYLDASFSNSFLWPTQLTMYAASGAKTGSSQAAPEYRVQIQAWCNGAAPANDTVCDNPVLHSLVYNAQPFAANTDNSFVNFTRLDKLLQARTALGANAFVSYDWALKKDALLYSDGNKNQLPNLLKFTSGNDSGIGVEGVLALQATYIPAQMSSSPIPPPPPPPEPPYTSQIPYTACDADQENQWAIASKTAGRKLPIPNADSNSSAYKCPSNENFVQGPAAMLRIMAFEGDFMVCKKNLPAYIYAESMDYPCKVPRTWKTCVTKDKGSTYPGFNGWTVVPGNDEGDYCWQPVIEKYWWAGGYPFLTTVLDANGFLKGCNQLHNSPPEEPFFACIYPFHRLQKNRWGVNTPPPW